MDSTAAPADEPNGFDFMNSDNGNGNGNGNVSAQPSAFDFVADPAPAADTTTTDASAFDFVSSPANAAPPAQPEVSGFDFVSSPSASNTAAPAATAPAASGFDFVASGASNQPPATSGFDFVAGGSGPPQQPTQAASGFDFVVSSSSSSMSAAAPAADQQVDPFEHLLNSNTDAVASTPTNNHQQPHKSIGLTCDVPGCNSAPVSRGV